MSYDVSIGDQSFNYTSNVAKLWYDHIYDNGKGGGLHELHGLTGKEAVALLGEAFFRIDDARFGNGRDHAFFSQYDAANGWGSAYGGLLFMARIMTACAKNPRKKVHVCA